MSDEKDSWWAKVEYQSDKTEAVVNVDWIVDLLGDDCPNFDPKRTYHVFWSKVDGDTPELFLERAPSIPFIKKEDEEKLLTGYYRAYILGIKGDILDFNLTRTRRSTQRGKQQTNTTQKKNLQQKNTSCVPSKGSKKAFASVKSQAIKTNLGHTDNVEVFSNLDKDLGLDESETTDDSDDPTLVSDVEVRVLRISVKNLKSKLVDKCAEIKSLQDKLALKEVELDKIRQLNIDLQERLLDSFSQSSNSCRSSRPSSSLSSASTEKSLPLLTKRKTPSSPFSNECSKKKYSQSSPSRSCESPILSYDDINFPSYVDLDALPKVPFTSSESPMLKISAICTSSPLPVVTPQRGVNICDGENSSSTPTRSLPAFNVFSHREKSIDIDMSGDTSFRLSGIEDYDLNCTSDSKEIHNTNESAEVTDMVDFCEGFSVNSKILQKIEGRALGKDEDGTFVKELAVLVFKHKVLYNSSIKERKTGSKEPRKKLDTCAVEEIRKRLEKRVKQEYNGQHISTDVAARYSTAKVNKFLYEKIKKMRSNPNLKHLADESV